MILCILKCLANLTLREPLATQVRLRTGSQTVSLTTERHRILPIADVIVLWLRHSGRSRQAELRQSISERYGVTLSDNRIVGSYRKEERASDL